MFQNTILKYFFLCSAQSSNFLGTILHETLTELSKLSNSIKFPQEWEKDGQISFLDLMLRRKRRKVDFDVHRNSQHIQRFVTFCRKIAAFERKGFQKFQHSTAFWRLQVTFKIHLWNKCDFYSVKDGSGKEKQITFGSFRLLKEVRKPQQLNGWESFKISQGRDFEERR